MHIDDLRKGWQENIDIYINIANTTFPRYELSNLFSKLCLFKPTSMEISKKCYGGSRRYNKVLFENAILDENNKHLGLYNTGASRITISIFANSAVIHIRMLSETWESKKIELLSLLDDFFCKLNGCFAFAVNSFDYNIVQNPSYINDYITYGVGEKDFHGIGEVPIIPSDDPALNATVDLSYLPGSELKYNDMIFTTAPYMWFGPDFIAFLSEDKIQAFNDCVDNLEYAFGYYKMCLWENISDYNNLTLRVRQRLLRDFLQLDDVIKGLNDESSDLQDPQIEFTTGKFTHGGILLAKFYIDKNGKSCSRSIAKFVITREMQGHTIVWQEKKKLR